MLPKDKLLLLLGVLHSEVDTHEEKRIIVADVMAWYLEVLPSKFGVSFLAQLIGPI